MENLECQIKGSNDTVHTIRLINEDNQVFFKCTCKGSISKKILCKHRMALLIGDVTNVVDKNIWDNNKFISQLSQLNTELQLG